MIIMNVSIDAGDIGVFVSRFCGDEIGKDRVLVVI